ncbi:hypothetical protein [Polaribacter sp. ALD11]|uniref:hypothetical protein n=1 Tax=Polaribacter sp. ALD11 TaxID=2058137 RepID=UPI0026DA0D56
MMKNTEEFNQFLNELSIEPIPVIDAAIALEKYLPIDISEKNTDLQNFDVSSSKEWEKHINSYLKKNEKEVAYGGI